MRQLILVLAYQISTLLQVSEIAKQQGDQSVSGDLLERALFSFGRSVHSSFPSALAEGKARLDFRRPENREFWLACWRYTSNLGQRGTWRTAYEWAKLLLSLEPEGDPYCVGLILDQLALRGGQGEHYTKLGACSLFQGQWARAPNVQISIALAEYKLKQAEKCRSTLSKALREYPWIFARLFQEINLSHIPKSIWGKQPRTEREKLESESYVTRAKDIWNTPENITLLVEVAESLDATSSGAVNDTPITLNEARHVLLSDTPALIAVLPRSFTTMKISSFDPLPPPDDLPSYNSTSFEDIHEPPSPTTEPLERETTLPQPSEETQEIRGLQSFFARIIPWLGSSAPANAVDRDSTIPGEENTEDLDRAVQEFGAPPEPLLARDAPFIQPQHDMEQQRQQQHYLDEQAEALVLQTSPPEGEQTEDSSRRLSDEELEWMMQHSNLRELMDNAPQPGIIRIDPNASMPPGLGPSTSAEPEAYDDERNQRWLAGQGMMRLRDFVERHGDDENVWLHDGSVDVTPVTEYAERVVLLEKRTTRNFILDYVLQQGTSSRVKELIVRFLEGQSGT